MALRVPFIAIVVCLACTTAAAQPRALRGGHATTAEKNIVQLASDTPDLSTLVSAVTAGDLVDTLSGKGPFTVFVPTNDAFAKVPASVLTALLDPDNKDKLQQLLKYHVASGAVTSSMLKNNEQIPTVEGSDLTVKIDTDDAGSTTVMINDAKVVTADVTASNGVVHVIDAVLIPPVLEELVASLSA